MDERTMDNGRVLVIDDDEAIRKVMELLLTNLGYEADFAEDGEEAIAIYRKTVDGDNPYDVVIVDLSLPGGMGGKEIIAELMVIDHEVRGIVSTGYLDDPVMTEFREFGFVAALAKPYSIWGLNETLDHVKNRR